MRNLLAVVVTLGVGAEAQDAWPTKVGDCVVTRVASVFRQAPGSGTKITYTDGLAQISHDEQPNAAASRPGDEIKLCLISIPRNTGCENLTNAEAVGCDLPGKVYRATNLRTGKHWKMPILPAGG